MKNKQEKVLLNGRQAMENIIVFGRGKYMHTKVSALVDQYSIIAILDNSVSQMEWDNEFQCNVYNPRMVIELPKVIIMCMSLDYIGMYHQLIELGVPGDRIKLGIEYEPPYNWGEELLSRNGKIIGSPFGIEYRYLDRIFSINHRDDMVEIARLVALEENDDIKKISTCKTYPLNRSFGRDLGTPVDRVYIENFLWENSRYIRGTVMEIESDDYTKKYGGDKVKEEIILHVMGWGGPQVLKGNFETGEGLKEDMVDCLICTQTLQYIYNLSNAVQNIYRIIRDEGTALITVPGIKGLSVYHDKHWGEYWSFTEKSVFKLFAEVFGPDNVEVKTYGNVKIASAYLYGVSAELIQPEDFQYNDPQIPFIITAKVRKNVR